jgi:hypothetical protein
MSVDRGSTPPSTSTVVPRLSTVTNYLPEAGLCSFCVLTHKYSHTFPAREANSLSLFYLYVLEQGSLVVWCLLSTGDVEVRSVPVNVLLRPVLPARPLEASQGLV